MFKAVSLFPIITNRFSLQYSRLSIEHQIRCRLSVVYASLVLSNTIADNLCVNISYCNYSSVKSRILGYALLVFQKRCLQQWTERWRQYWLAYFYFFHCAELYEKDGALVQQQLTLVNDTYSTITDSVLAVDGTKYSSIYSSIWLDISVHKHDWMISNRELIGINKKSRSSVPG